MPKKNLLSKLIKTKYVLILFILIAVGYYYYKKSSFSVQTPVFNPVVKPPVFNPVVKPPVFVNNNNGTLVSTVTVPPGSIK